MEILIFKTHFFKFEISKGAVIRSGMVQSDMWNKHPVQRIEEILEIVDALIIIEIHSK